MSKHKKGSRSRPAEPALEDVLQLNKQIIQSAQEGIIVYGPDLRYRIWNPFMEHFSGVPASEVVGKHPLELFPFLKDGGVIEQLEKVLAGVPVAPHDFPFHVPSTGRSGWASDLNSPLYNQRGEIIGVIGMVRDVTERKRSEAAIRASNEKFSKIYNMSPDAIDLTHLETGVQVEANQSYARMFGHTREELIGHSTLPGDLGIWVNKEDRARLIESIKEHGEVREFETFLRRKNGDVFSVLISSSILEIAGEQYNLSICRDIHDRKLAEEQLKMSEEKFARIYHLGPDAIDLTHFATNLQMEINPAHEKMFGYNRDELIGHTALPDDLNMWLNGETPARTLRTSRQENPGAGRPLLFDDLGGLALTPKAVVYWWFQPRRGGWPA